MPCNPKIPLGRYYIFYSHIQWIPPTCKACPATAPASRLAENPYLLINQWDIAPCVMGRPHRTNPREIFSCATDGSRTPEHCGKNWRARNSFLLHFCIPGYVLACLGATNQQNYGLCAVAKRWAVTHNSSTTSRSVAMRPSPFFLQWHPIVDLAVEVDVVFTAFTVSPNFDCLQDRSCVSQDVWMATM